MAATPGLMRRPCEETEGPDVAEGGDRGTALTRREGAGRPGGGLCHSPEQVGAASTCGHKCRWAGLTVPETHGSPPPGVVVSQGGGRAPTCAGGGRGGRGLVRGRTEEEGRVWSDRDPAPQEGPQALVGGVSPAPLSCNGPAGQWVGSGGTAGLTQQKRGREGWRVWEGVKTLKKGWGRGAGPRVGRRWGLAGNCTPQESWSPAAEDLSGGGAPGLGGGGNKAQA